MATPDEPHAVSKVDLASLGVDRGGHLLVKRALEQVPVGARVAVSGRSPELGVDLRAWCRAQGHEVAESGGDWLVRRGSAQAGRFRNAETTRVAEVVNRPPARWGLAARGATVEAGSPPFDFDLDDKTHVWSDEAARLYAQAVAAQWNPETAISWDIAFELPEDVENAVVQLMTYLVENETAALIVPAGFVARLHPHFREVMQLLAVQAADEARHIEVFTRRGLLRRPALGLSTAAGQASLRTLLEERQFALASFLLSVLGEGSFLSLLAFLRDHAPDPVTRDVAKLAAQDEARHVAFGLSHLERHVSLEPAFRGELASAIRRRHDALASTVGLNEEVFDALVLVAAGSFRPEDIERGWDAVVSLVQDMDTGRRRRLERLGFSAEDARDLSALHTKNFM